MPLYEYECDTCGHRFETIQRFSDPPLDRCPNCGGAVRKLQSAPAFHLKGSGWYITDYARKDTDAKSGDQGGEKPGDKAGDQPGGKTTESSGGSKAEGKTEGRTEGKPEGKSEGKGESKGEVKPAAGSSTAPPAKPPDAKSS
jgi:putative FmdB family regulatory protein